MRISNPSTLWIMNIPIGYHFTASKTSLPRDFPCHVHELPRKPDRDGYSVSTTHAMELYVLVSLLIPLRAAILYASARVGKLNTLSTKYSMVPPWAMTA